MRSDQIVMTRYSPEGEALVDCIHEEKYLEP